MSRVDDVAAELIAEQEENSQLRLDDNVRMSLNTDAEKRLKAEHLAQVIGEPDVDFVERNYAIVERSARTRGLYDALPANSVTRNILSDPRERASLPDAENLAKIEGSITAFGNVAPSYRKGRDVHAGGKQAYQMMVSGSDDATYDTTMKSYRDRMDSVQYGDLNWAQRIPGYSAEMAGLYAGVLPDAGMAAAYAGTGAGMAAGPQAVAPAALTGFKIGTTKELFEIEAGWAFDEFRSLKFDATGETIDRNAAIGASLLVGGINASLEFIGFNAAVLHAYGLPQLVKSLGKGGVKNLLNNPAARDALSKIGQDYAAGVITEGTTEALQELSRIGFGDLLKGAYSSFETYTARMWDSFQAGAGGAAGIAAPGAAIRTTNVALDNRKQKQQQDAIAALGEDIKTSKLYSNAPKKFQEFIRAIQERHGTVDTVYMDAEAAQTYFQNIDLADLQKDMPETAVSLREAMDTGGYVAIPLDEFVTYVAPNMADVAQDITFDPLTPTQRQFEEIESKAKELQDWYEKTQGQIDQAEDPVYGQVYTELLGAGRKADVAEKEAMLFTTMIRRMAERVGMDPEEYYRSKKISIRGELIQQDGIDVPTATGGLINLLREGRGPQQKDVFGPSLIEFLMTTGILDEGGELSARDLEKQIPAYGRRRLARESGIPMSEAFERARDAGYLDLGEYTSEENALLAAIDRELGGDRVYSPNQISVGAQELDTALEQLRELIDREGLNLDTMTNEEIMDRLGITELEQPGDGPRLSAIHSLTSENLLFADNLGGLAVPSIAVVKEGMAHSGYGEITLIGTEDLGNPEKVTVYDSDAYTSTFPRPEYPKVKSSTAQALVDAIRDWVTKIEGKRGYVIDATWDYAVNNPNPEKIVQEWMRSNGIKAMFLDEVGAKPTKVVMRDVALRHPESKHPDVIAFFKAHPGDYTDEMRKALAGPLTEAIRETYKDAPGLADDMIKSALDDEGAVNHGPFARLQRDQENIGKQEVDEYATGERLNKKLKGKEAEFQAWVNDKVMAMFGDPYLKVGGKKKPYTLDNIVDFMTRGGTQAKEKNMTFGEGMARATAAKKYTDLEWMRNEAAWKILPESEIKAGREKAQALMEAYREAVIDYYTVTDWRGNLDTWGGLDASMKVMAEWAKNSMRLGDKAAIKAALRKNNFKGVPDDVVQMGIEAGKAMMSAPLPYFEAKPERAVNLDEFVGAVVPDDVSQEVLDVLDKHGIRVQKYGARYDEAARESAIGALTESLHRGGSRVLFQNDEPSPKFKAAMDKLLADRSGEIEAALVNSAIGPIDILWGKEGDPDDNYSDGYGLAKILKKHPEINPYALEDIVARAKVLVRDENRIILETPEHTVAVRLDWEGKKKHWLLTAYEPGKRFDPARATRTTDVDNPTAAKTTPKGQEAGSGKSVSQKGKVGRGPRGYLTVTPQALSIFLTKNANLSTFIHESGHLFLELMKDAAALADVDPQLLADWETVKAYLGSDGTLTREQHETFARSFEAYLFEGKAPTKELAGLFSRFKSWLIGVYKTLNKLDVQLTDDIRAVFDRMLVAEASIERAADDIVPAFKGGTGLSDTEINALMELQRQALRAGQDEMEAQAQSEIRAMRTEAYRNRRDALTQEVTAKVDAQPVYAVQRLLRTGNDERMNVPEHLLGKKLSSQAVINLFIDPKVLRRIPGLTRKEGGVHPDVLADLYGFESGYQMVQQIIAAPSRSEVIRNQVQAQLDEEFGNMAQDTETIERAALALHNNAMANFLVAEARAMNRKLGRKDNVTLNQATKEAARRHVARLKLRQIRPHAYYQAELKAARASQEAVAAGKFEEAAQLKQQQLLNHHLYREARTAIDRADLIRRKLKKYDSASVMQTIRKGDPMAANGIEALLAGVELKKTALTRIDARNRLAQYVQAMEAQGETVLIDPALYDGADLVNYKEMTLEQLEALDSSVAALAKQGRDANRVRVEGELVEMAQVIEDLDAVASTNLTAKQINQYDVDHRSPLTKAFSSFLASLRKIEFECRFADGDIVGKWHRTIFQPFVDAQNAKEEMLSTSVAELQSIMGTLTRKDAQRLNQSINFLGTTLNRGDLYVVALNMGNQGNWDRLFSRRWKGQEREVLAKLQDELTLEDFRRIEALGQMIDRMYEPMAAVSERVDGIRPPKVEAKPLYLAKYGVELSGWYYPVKYQDAIGTREASVLEESNSIDMGPSPITGQVSKSMTKSRMTGAGGVISLDFAGLPQHLHQVVHYITHYEAVRNFDKLRRKSEFRAMYESYFDANGYKQLRSWLQNIATNGTIAQTSHDASKTMDTIFRRARFGGSLLGLGWKVSSAVMQVLGTGPAAKEVGALNMASWLLKLSYGRVGTLGQARVHPDYQRALDASPELRHLDSQIDRDIREFTDRAVEVMEKAPGLAQLRWIESNAYYLIIAMQKHINAATWLAAHEKAQGEGRSVTESVQYADATVRQTQSGGGLKDLAGIQQGNELTKLVTLFYTYFSLQHNQLRLTGRQDLIKGFIKGDGPNGRAKSLGKFVAANMYIVLVPSLVEALMKYDEDDDDEIAPYLATRIASSYVAGVPIFRDVYSAATRDWQAPSTPLDQVVQSLVKALDGAYDIGTGESNYTDLRNIAKAITLISYIPIYQALTYYEALATSEDFGEAVSHVLFGTPYSAREKLDD